MKALKKLLFFVALSIGVVLAVPGVGFSQPQLAAKVMPVTEQNLLVEKYCTVCHTDTSMTGGLSLEHFDAAHLDPSLC